MQSCSRTMQGQGCSKGKGLCADAAGLGKVQHHFLLGLIVPTGALHEPRPRCLGILLGRDLCPCILLAPHL
jgi:hypothetical protein